MGKLVFFLMIAVLVYWLIKARSSEDTENPEDSNSEENTAPKSLEEMVRCAHCGVHLPRSESITSQGEFYCSNDHRLEHQDSSS
ncbi:PP0621 family protein [Nitrosomonas sp. Nm51]|uniref:PP0621 family protein n=1 Tax=Nitrosomonas sp. Nm51 TaxID=133720 RepID=UPI000B811937|nr:PP0621 family protein [Nitrosomonas sp. Nm51]